MTLDNLIRTKLADAWFRPKRIEGQGRVYVWLGARLFQRILLRLTRGHGEAGGRPDAYRLRDHSGAALREFELRTRRNELIHLLGLVPGVLGMLVAGASGKWYAVLFFFLFAMNFHPIILQRYNRIRLLRVEGRRGAVGSS